MHKKTRKQRIPGGAEDSSCFRGRLDAILGKHSEGHFPTRRERNVQRNAKLGQYVLKSFLSQFTPLPPNFARRRRNPRLIQQIRPNSWLNYCFPPLFGIPSRPAGTAVRNETSSDPKRMIRVSVFSPGVPNACVIETTAVPEGTSPSTNRTATS